MKSLATGFGDGCGTLDFVVEQDATLTALFIAAPMAAEFERRADKS